MNLCCHSNVKGLFRGYHCCPPSTSIAPPWALRFSEMLRGADSPEGCRFDTRVTQRLSSRWHCLREWYRGLRRGRQQRRGDKHWPQRKLVLTKVVSNLSLSNDRNVRKRASAQCVGCLKGDERCKSTSS